jgi:hypothetical protein
MRLPPQNPPVERSVIQSRMRRPGVEPSASPCDSLTGMARQLCYAFEYGIAT